MMREAGAQVRPITGSYEDAVDESRRLAESGADERE